MPRDRASCSLTGISPPLSASCGTASLRRWLSYYDYPLDSRCIVSECGPNPIGAPPAAALMFMCNARGASIPANEAARVSPTLFDFPQSVEVSQHTFGEAWRDIAGVFSYSVIADVPVTTEW